MDLRVFLLSAAFLVAVQLFSAAGMTAKCGDYGNSALVFVLQLFTCIYIHIYIRE